MTGHPRQDLTALLDGALPPDRAADVRDHLDRCAACRAEHSARPVPGPDELPPDPDSFPSDDASPEEVARGKALEAAVRELLDRLPEKQRAALVLCRFEGLSYEEIAQVLETTVPAVKSLVHRATVAAAEALTPAEAPLETVRGHRA